MIISVFSPVTDDNKASSKHLKLTLRKTDTSNQYILASDYSINKYFKKHKYT